MSTTSVAVFLKEPTPGKVKTRLARTIGAEAAASLYRSFALDTLDWLGKLRGVERFICFTPRGAREACAQLVPGRAGSFRMLEQASGSLGRRLDRAFREILRPREARAVIIGTDCPLLDARLVRRALAALGRSDLVLGPARDGGYYLIGLRKPEPELFRGIPWSTAGVLESTLRNARRRRLSTELLPVLGDVDEDADLLRLREELLAAWHEAARGARRDFPRRTFRELSWALAESGAGAAADRG